MRRGPSPLAKQSIGPLTRPPSVSGVRQERGAGPISRRECTLREPARPRARQTRARRARPTSPRFDESAQTEELATQPPSACALHEADPLPPGFQLAAEVV